MPNSVILLFGILLGELGELEIRWIYGSSILPLLHGLHLATRQSAFGIPIKIPLFFITWYAYSEQVG